jgi:hypothetical protein
MPGGEGFGDPSVFASAAPRTAVGITEDNRLLLVTTARGTSLARLAAAMREMGAVYAVNLDGGASAAMWHRGRMIRRPRTPLTNILGVYLKPEPVSQDALRPPRGLDWRGGHRPRPIVRFAAGEVRLSVTLPRRWEDGGETLIEADGQLPDGWSVIVLLDGSLALLADTLPVVMPLDTAHLRDRPRHSFCVRVLDGEGKAAADAERIFRVGEEAR